jgi:hypothetical protein
MKEGNTKIPAKGNQKKKIQKQRRIPLKFRRKNIQHKETAEKSSFQFKIQPPPLPTLF